MNIQMKYLTNQAFTTYYIQEETTSRKKKTKSKSTGSR
jgi:hypothetical protein